MFDNDTYQDWQADEAQAEQAAAEHDFLCDVHDAERYATSLPHDAKWKAANNFYTGYANGVVDSTAREAFATAIRAKEHLATRLSEIPSPRQLGVLRQIRRDYNIDPAAECESKFNCSISELNKSAADTLIAILRAKGRAMTPARLAA